MLTSVHPRYLTVMLTLNAPTLKVPMAVFVNLDLVEMGELAQVHYE